ncbi:SHOCT domain-containing protein [Mycoplasmatota bacterium WC44]
MNYLSIIWIIVIGFWVFGKLSNTSNGNNKDNIKRPPSYVASRQSRPTNSTNVTSGNIYKTSERDVVDNELRKVTVDSIENVKTLYESGIISREEYKEYKQKIR